MTIDWKKICAIVVVLIVVFASGFGCGRNARDNGDSSEIKPRVDTLIIRDTITREKPIYITRHVVDTVRIPVYIQDTQAVRDTVYIRLPREQVQWADEYAVVFASGITPQVDSVQHFLTERVITRETVRRETARWGLGVHMGYGVGITNNKINQSPYIGIGVSYNIINW